MCVITTTTTVTFVTVSEEVHMKINECLK